MSFLSPKASSTGAVAPPPPPPTLDAAAVAPTVSAAAAAQAAAAAAGRSTRSGTVKTSAQGAPAPQTTDRVLQPITRSSFGG